MGEITSGISVLLGSAVVSTIITTIFNQYNNRKSNALKYITEERKAWRESIRLIAEKIQECEFEGKGKKDIEKYLVELELNINSYGRGNNRSTKEDAYIWNEIDEIRKVDNEEYFEKHKELLIYYISLMIKADWDRSKNEVVGYSQMLVEVLTIMLINVVLACLYLYIGKKSGEEHVNVLGKVIIYTGMLYMIFKYMQYVANIISLPLNIKIVIGFGIKMFVMLFIVISITTIVVGNLHSILNEKFPKEGVMNLTTALICYVEAAKIFWNWFSNNMNECRFMIQVVENREKILKESDMKIKIYRENTEEIWRYIKDNQDDTNRVKMSVSSLRRLLNKYEREVKKNLQKECKKTMTADVRNRVKKLENDLQVIKQYRKNISRYYNLGLFNKVPYAKQMHVNLWNK